MSDQSKVQRGSTDGAIALPHPDIMTYPIKITRVLVAEGEGFQANLTPLYSAMDANGKTQTFGAADAGKVISVLIKVDDIFTERANAFDVRYFAVATPAKDAPPPPPEPAPAPAPPTPPPEPAPAPPTPDTQQDPQPDPVAQTAAGRTQPVPETKTRATIGWILSIAFWAAMAYGVLQLLIYDEGARTRPVAVVLETRLVYFGSSEINRTSGQAVVLAPTGPDASGVMQYTELRCDLTYDEYDKVVEQMQNVGGTNYTWWFVWRSQVFRDLNCEPSITRSRWRPTTFDDRMLSMDPARLRAFLDNDFIREMRDHDAGE